MNPARRTCLALLALAMTPAAVQAAVALDQLVIDVPQGVNRQVSFSNKQSAYFYTQTGVNDHPEHAWFRGLNIAGRRIFNDLHLSNNGVGLDHAQARASVSPDAVAWTYPDGTTETIRLFDDRNLIEVAIDGPARQPALRLAGDTLQADGRSGAVDWYTSTNDKDKVDQVGVLRAGASFFIAVAESREAAARLLEEAPSKAIEWQEQRRKRLASLVNGDHFLATDDERTTRALRWLILTTDELVTKQRGEGIYAGLPWFNEYWGRDSFIALPGATLVTGQFETARAILKSFAQFQELDRTSKFHGRVPNIVKPGSLDYHTTDGTPRFILSLRDYVRYSGDRSIVAELYPNIEASIEGSLANWTDEAGYLVHADNETWMDARRNPDLAAYSPRANRANDIQALWHEQLLAGAEFAAMQGDQAAAMRWTQAAQRVRSRFAADFVEPKTGAIADHLDAAGRPDFTLRPNLLFALDMVSPEVASRELRRTWQALVFPWGVATLDPNDKFFHAYHLAPGRYPKDEAYHNGTIWPWLDGIALQRMIEHGQVDRAWPLFRFNIDLALDRGVVGGLPETMDAYPHPGEDVPRLTGTFLQAWSNTEQLRIWYQYVLGLRPDMGRGEIVLAPRLPSTLGAVEFHARAGAGTISGTFDRIGNERRYRYRLEGQAATLAVDLPPYPIVKMKAEAGDSLNLSIDDGRLQVRVTSSAGASRDEISVAASEDRRRAASRLETEFEELRFAAPDPKIAGEPGQGEVEARDASRTARNALPSR